jgi:plastocyanin
MTSHRGILIWVAMLWAAINGLSAQATKQVTTTQAGTAQVATTKAPTTTVHGRVEVVGAITTTTSTNASKARHETAPGTVVWLTPLTAADGEATAPPDPGDGHPAQTLRLVQKNKSFEPHILVVRAGSTVEFPNRDPFFHNVFSLFEGKRFDLGLYEAGTSRTVRFDRPGISYIFCNIHPEMSAVVITIATPLYAVSNAEGQLSLADVPYGRYLLHVWSEGMGPENTQPITREITIAENASSLGIIRVPAVNAQRMAHKNKYGRDYDEPTPSGSVYEHQR